jgi:GNAT superfamily N-acetyltransferase
MNQAITVRRDVEPEDTMIFEALYEDDLQLDLDEKTELLRHDPLAVWVFVDQVLAGETYGLSPAQILEVLGEEIPDIDPSDDRSIYCYSTTIVPTFRGRGLGTLLKAFWLGMVMGRGRTRVIGHATSPAMYQIDKHFGA